MSKRIQWQTVEDTNLNIFEANSDQHAFAVFKFADGDEDVDVFLSEEQTLRLAEQFAEARRVFSLVVHHDSA